MPGIMAQRVDKPIIKSASRRWGMSMSTNFFFFLLFVLLLLLFPFFFFFFGGHRHTPSPICTVLYLEGCPYPYAGYHGATCS